MTINDNSIFDTETSLRRIEPSRTRVIVYTTNMEEGRTAEIKLTEVGAGSEGGGDDYSQYSKEVSVNYLSNKTHDAKNLYPINKGSTKISTRNPDGTPAAIADSSNAAEKQYFDEFTTDDMQGGVSKFKNLSESEFLRLEVKKGKGLNGVLPSVNELYNQIIPSGENSSGLLPRTVERRLADNNQLNPGGKFIPSDFTATEDNTQVGTILLQPKFGVHSPRKFPTTETANLAGDRKKIVLTSNELKQLGVNILFAAAGENVVNFVAQAAGENAESTLEVSGQDPLALARIGVKIPVNRFSPTEIVASTNPDFVKPTNKINLDSELANTHGSPYNPEFIFGNVSSTLTSTLMISVISALCAAVAQAYAAFPAFNLVIGGQIFADTNHAYNKCVEKGLGVFFKNIATAQGFTDRAYDIGYQNTIARNLIKVIYQDLGLANDDNINVANIITKIPELGRSRIVQFMNIIAKIGDIYLTPLPNLSELSGSNANDVTSFTKESTIIDTFGSGEDLEINTAALIKKIFLSTEASRIVGVPGNDKFGQKGTQAIASNTTPSRFILPDSLLGAAIRGDVGQVFTLQNRRNTTSTQSARLDPAEVTAIENKLEASYVPFYMHDLRTNEVISFHAFLESLADNYTPRYSETDGYGRIDSIQTYTSTKRDISFDFTVVATNEKDFEDMWYKINKLTTFLYPQFTQGRALQTADGNKFIQPFSQLPGSSPMIRLRIGDVIKSNFSGFNLARLFGLGETNDVFQIDAASRTFDENQRRLPEEIEAVREEMLNGNYNAGDSLNVNLILRDYQIERERRLSWVDGITIRAPGGLALVAASGESEDTRLARQTRILNSILSHQATIEVVEVFSDEFSATFGVTSAEILNVPPGRRISSSIITYKIKFQDPLPSSEITTEDEFFINLNYFEFSPIESEIARVARARIPGYSEERPENEILTFFSKTENPIFKSFESTRGKGLAGFITNLSFTWIEENIIWSTDRLQYKAPKMCKIRASFTPVHDIAPGIDSNGFNRAPIYPVGRLSNATRFDIGGDIDDRRDYALRTSKISFRPPTET